MSVVTPGSSSGEAATSTPSPVDSDPLLAPIPLPETRRTTSTRRRAARRRRQRRVRLAGAGGIIAVVVVLVVAGSLFATTHRKKGSSNGAGSGTPARAAIPPVLLAQKDDTGRVVALTALVPAANNRGGALVLIPPGTMTQVASSDLQPVGSTLAIGGPEQLQSTVRNLLGAPIAETIVVDRGTLAAMVAPAGPLTVTIPSRVEQVAPNGSIDVVYEAGPMKIAPNDVPALLATRGQGNDLARLARHQAFWEAWLARLHDQPSAIPAQPPGLHRALVALAAGSVRTRVVPVTSLGTSTDDGELYKVETDELRRMVADTFPGANTTGPGARPTVQILNGTGAIGLAQRVQDKLGPAVEVKLTGNASSFSYAQTQIVFYDRAEQAVAERVQKQLGVGQLVFSRTPIDVVDITIVVGKDFS